jgi:chromosome segregation ATPase
MDNLRRRLRDCQEFKKKVTNLGINNSEEPGDLEELDNQTLIQEILDLQGKLKACGIALIELEEARERDRHYIPSDEELDEELVNQDQDNGRKRNERLRDLEAGINRLKKALSDCRDNESARNQALQDQITALENDAFQKEVAYQEKIDNLEETEPMDFLKRGIQKLRDEAKDAKAKLKECELQTQSVQVDAFRAEIDRLKQELLAQQQKCETEKEALRQQVQKLQGNAATPEGTESADIVKLQAEIKRLQEQLAKQEGHLEKEKKTVGLLRKTTNDQYAALQKEKLASAKCNEKLAALRKTQQPGSGFGNPATISAAADGEPQKEDILECWAEVARLKHLIANFESEKAGLTNQLQKQREMNTKLARQIMQSHGANNDDYWAEVARLKNLINNLEDEKAKLTKQLQEHEQVNAELTSHFMQSSDGNSNDDDRGDKDRNTAERPLPIGFNDFYPDNVAYDDEIEALNNQITSLKQEIAALEQQAALDKLEIDALKENNTNKSEAYKKFVALVEKLRAELEGLHAKLAECKSTFSYSIFPCYFDPNKADQYVGAGETWQERRARMRRLAAANRGPRNPATHLLDPALAQIEEWKNNGWWKFERPS